MQEQALPLKAEPIFMNISDIFVYSKFDKLEADLINNVIGIGRCKTAISYYIMTQTCFEAGSQNIEEIEKSAYPRYIICKSHFKDAHNETFIPSSESSDKVVSFTLKGTKCIMTPCGVYQQMKMNFSQKEQPTPTVSYRVTPDESTIDKSDEMEVENTAAILVKFKAAAMASSFPLFSLPPEQKIPTPYPYQVVSKPPITEETETMEEIEAINVLKNLGKFRPFQ